jgi:hypothetical protein
MTKYVKLFENWSEADSELFGLGLGSGLDQWLQETLSERLNGISPEIYVDPLTSMNSGWRTVWALRLPNTGPMTKGRDTGAYVIVEVFSTTTPENSQYVHNKVTEGPEIRVWDSIDGSGGSQHRILNSGVNTSVSSERQRLEHGTGPIQIPVDECSSAAEALDLAVRHATLLIQTLPQRSARQREIASQQAED